MQRGRVTERAFLNRHSAPGTPFGGQYTGRIQPDSGGRELPFGSAVVEGQEVRAGDRVRFEVACFAAEVTKVILIERKGL